MLQVGASGGRTGEGGGALELGRYLGQLCSVEYAASSSAVPSPLSGSPQKALAALGTALCF